jgi:hypothetical protein
LPITSAAVICHRGITCRSYKTWAKDGELHVCIMSLAKLARSLNQSMRLASTSLERVHAGPTRRDNHQRRRLDAGLGPHTSPERASRAAVEAADYVSPRRRPITTESIGSAAPHPSLRGALATKQPGATDARPLDCLASLTRNREHSVRGSPLCHTRESGYPAGRDAAAQGLRLAGVASSRNSVGVVVSWMPAFAGMTRGKRPIRAPVV